ncbi:ShTK domain protein [Aphelenchoides fujianensis]|nr:ShTK domain protein [Aphelenchoides fujianensis]
MKSQLLAVYLFFYFASNVWSQTCPDGFPAVFKCVASRTHKGGYVCKGDPNLGCEFLNGVSYCCESEKNAEDGGNSTTSGSTSSTDPTATTSETPRTTRRFRPRTDERRSSLERSGERGEGDRSNERGRGRGECEDRGPDCSRLSYLCNNPIYQPLMERDCPRSCNNCRHPVRNVHSTEDGNDNDRDARNGREIETDCRDRGPDCARSIQLCHNPIYADFMSHECPQSCGTC